MLGNEESTAKRLLHQAVRHAAAVGARHRGRAAGSVAGKLQALQHVLRRLAKALQLHDDN